MDFQGNFFDDWDALNALKSIFDSLVSDGVGWWHLREKGLLDRLHYPVTSSAEEWQNEIMNLDKLLVEGLEEKWLRRKAIELGRQPDDRLRSLKLLEDCLIGLRFEEDHARALVAPFHEVHNLRSTTKGHAGGETARQLRRDVLQKHQTYRKHFEELCDGCYESLQIIARAFR